MAMQDKRRKHKTSLDNFQSMPLATIKQILIRLIHMINTTILPTSTLQCHNKLRNNK